MDQIKARNAISEPQATTGNYFEVARQDDQDVETPHSGSIVPVPEDGQATKPTRSERMRAAVERSRSEYKAQHVYTEPLWFTKDTNDEGRAIKPKMNSQNLEFLVSSLYYSSPPQYAAALQSIMAAFDPKAKALGDMSKELIQTGMDCALRLEDSDSACCLAESTSSLWQSQPGVALSAGECFLSASRGRDALVPLLTTSNAYGLNVPVLKSLRSAIDSISAHDTAQPALILGLRCLLQREIDRQVLAYDSPLNFPAEGEDLDPQPLKSISPCVAQITDSMPDLDVSEVTASLGLDPHFRAYVEKAVHRLKRTGRDVPMEPGSGRDRGVRQL